MPLLNPFQLTARGSGSLLAGVERAIQNWPENVEQTMLETIDLSKRIPKAAYKKQIGALLCRFQLS